MSMLISMNVHMGERLIGECHMGKCLIGEHLIGELSPPHYKDHWDGEKQGCREWIVGGGGRESEKPLQDLSSAARQS